MSEEISDSGKIPKIYFESLRSKIEDYFRLFQSRNRSKMSGRYSWWYICNRKKFQKLFQAIEANSKTTFNYFSPEIDQKRVEDISDTISVPGKIPMNHSESSEASRETTFDYSTLETSQTSANNIAEYIYPFERKFQTIIPNRLNHNERLFSMKAFHKSINNVRMTYLMIYRARKNSPKNIPIHFVNILRLLLTIAQYNPVKRIRTN